MRLRLTKAQKAKLAEEKRKAFLKTQKIPFANTAKGKTHRPKVTITGEVCEAMADLQYHEPTFRGPTDDKGPKMPRKFGKSPHFVSTNARILKTRA